MSTKTDNRPLISAITTFVTNCMKDHDPSHNPSHIHRVETLALSILKSEESLHPARNHYDPLIVHLSALLHDIGDRKYLPQVLLASSTNPGKGEATIPANKMVEAALLSHGASAEVAIRVQTIVSHVSYTTERKDPDRVRRLIEEEGYPELAIVQDADRLDAIGAVGIGRCFTFLGAKGKDMVPPGGEWLMDGAIEHFGDKLEKLEGMMKTETGRRMARRRTERLEVFRSWWVEEMNECSYST